MIHHVIASLKPPADVFRFLWCVFLAVITAAPLIILALLIGVLAGCANTFMTIHTYNIVGQVDDETVAQVKGKLPNMMNTVNIGVSATPKTTLTDSLNPDVKVTPIP